MVFKLVLFLIVFGLQDICSGGKIFTVADHPEKYGLSDFSVGSFNIQRSSETDADDVELPENGQSQVESLRDYISTIERYMPAIKENVENIQRFFGYNPNDERLENNRNQLYENDYAEGIRNLDLERPWGYQRVNQEREFYSPRMENLDEARINNYGDGGVNETFIPGFSQLPRPDINWQFNKDERIEQMRDVPNRRPTFKDISNGVVTSNFNPNYVNPNRFTHNHGFFKDAVKEVKHHGMDSPCDEYGNPMPRYDFGSESVKPLVININSDCSGHPKGRFMNGLDFQSRGHCRPVQFNPHSHHTPKYLPPLHFREILRYYCK